MKKIKYLLVPTLILTLGLGVNSCTDDFEEINSDPLALTADKVDASLIGLAFAQTQYATMNGLHWRFQISQNLFSDLYAQYYATTQSNFDSDRYLQVGRWSDLCWTSFYGQAAPNIKFVEDFTAGEFSEENANPVWNAVAKIWRVMRYHRIADMIAFFGHAIGETNEDLKALLGAAPEFPGPRFYGSSVLVWTGMVSSKMPGQLNLKDNAIGLHNE